MNEFTTFQPSTHIRRNMLIFQNNKFLGSLGVTIAFIAIGLNYPEASKASIAPKSDQAYQAEKTVEIKPVVPPGFFLVFGSIGGRANANVPLNACNIKDSYPLFPILDPSPVPVNNAAIAICTLAASFAASQADGSFNNNTYVGTAKVNGRAKVSPNLVFNADASSASVAVASLRQITANPDGTITVSNPIIKTGVGLRGSTQGGVARDPISFLAQNLTTGETLLEGTFLDIIADFNDGTFDLNNNFANFIEVTEGYFSINLGNPFINESGTLLAKISNGLLVTSEDSGIFDGLLPSVGSTGTFGFPLPDITFSYDLPDFGENILFTVNSSVSGSASASVSIPEPSSILSLLALGTLGATSALKRKLKSSTEKETTKIS